MFLTTSYNELQFKSPIRYCSTFSALILSIILLKVEKRSGDDSGGLYQVDTREGIVGHLRSTNQKKDRLNYSSSPEMHPKAIQWCYNLYRLFLCC